MQKLFKKVIQCSNRRWLTGFSVAALLACASFGQVSTGKVENKDQNTTPSKDRANLANIKAGLINGPLTFEVNRGQTDAKVKFLTRAQGFTVFMMPGETLMRGRNADVLRMKLQNGNQSPKLFGEDRQAKITNYYIGNDRSKWLVGLPNYGQVRYQEVYSGIDMVYHSDQHKLEYDFVVKPGADPSQIQVAFEGASNLRINEQGELELKSAAGTSVNHKPVVYQMVGGKRKVVQGEYALAKNTVGFKLGAYDKSQPLIIDPTLQVLSFFGGTLNDEAAAVATSASPTTGAGVVFVGRTESVSLPSASNTKSNGINWDGFATGLNAGTAGVSPSAGTTVLWTTYIGGSADDAARGVALDNQGNVYVVGYTNSFDFAGATAPPVNYDGFIVKLAAAGGSRSATALYGGTGVDQITSVTLDYSTFASLPAAVSITSPATDPRVAPNVVVGGWTTGNIGGTGSTTIALAGGAGNSATTTPDGNQRVFNQCDGGGACPPQGTTDGFVAVFNNTLQLRHATYLGGGGNDQVNAVAADVWGNIFATGYATPATSPLFPVVNGIGIGGTGAPAQDAALNTATINGQRVAVAFVAKYACAVTDGTLATPALTSGVFPIGVPSAPPRIEACAGRNSLSILSNSALFGGSGAIINPQQVALGQQAISEAGLGIAVDLNGWGSSEVSSNPSTLNQGFPNIVPFTDAFGVSSTGDTIGASVIVGAQAPLVEPCIPPGRNNTQANATFCVVTPAPGTMNQGGFQPGVAGPRVYVVGSTPNANFINSLNNPSCASAVTVSASSNLSAPGGQGGGPVAVPSLCNVPPVTGASVVAAGTLPNPANGPAPITAIGGVPSGQTQGWLVAFQFPAVTQVVVTPAGTTTPELATTLAPPTIPMYIVLQPPTCPGYLNADTTNGACLEGAAPGNAAVGTTTAPLLCTGGGAANIACPAAFIGSWNSVAVDSDQQVYVVGQIGMSGAARGTFGAGLANRLALEMERINLNGQPELIFPNSTTPATSTFLVDVGTTGSNYCQILPTAPPSPDPNQPGGLSCGIAINSLREAFFAGTTTATPAAAGTAPAQASATANLTNTPGAVTIGVCPTPNPAPGGGGATGGPICPAGQTGGAGYSAATPPTVTVNNITCATAPGPFTVTLDGNGTITAISPAVSGAGCTATGGSPTVTISAPPPATAAAFSLTNSPIGPRVPPVPATSFNLGGAGNSSNASTAPATEDVLYSAVQFYDAIAAPAVINFTASVNSVASITSPDGTTGASGNPAVPLAKAFINFTNWQGQPLNIPPGCVITPVVPLVTQPGGAYTPFTVTPIQGTSQFEVTVNTIAVQFPGVVTSLITFNKTSQCTGVNQPALESFDPVRVTLTVSAPLTAVPENTLVITSALGSGIVQPYTNNGFQLVADQFLSTFVDVSTADASGPINVTAQILPGQNWAGAVLNAITIPNRTNTIYSVGGPGRGFLRSIPVNINTQQIANLPVNTYTATLVIAASPETPTLPSSGSTACGSPGTPLGSGTTSALCIPISITIGAAPITNIPAAIVFGANATTPQQTGLEISNPLGTGTTFNFTTFYTPTPIYGTALPAANVFFVGTGSTLTSAIGNSVAGSIAAGGTFNLPIQVNPVGLTTGVYSGQLLVSGNGLASGATPQTTVPIIVYVGPKSGEDTPSGNGLGLMLPVNMPPTGTGVLPGTIQTSVNPTAPSPGAYPLILNVASGFGPTGANQTPNPTIVQVTGLNNASATTFNVNPPTVQGFPAGVVTVTNPGSAFGTNPSACNGTFAQVASFPSSVLGPSCAYSVWVDATTLNGSNTTPLAACGTAPNNFGLTGSLLFSPAASSFPFAPFTVPVTICVTDFPALILSMPQTFPNPTFGPFTAGGGNPVTGIAQPSNLTPGFTQSLVDMQIAAGSGCSGTTCTTGSINLFSQVGNSGLTCKVLDIHTNGGIIPTVTIAPTGNQWLTIQQAPALFQGVGIGTFNGLGVAGLTPINTAFGAQFLAGPATITPAMRTFQLCANTDPLGNAVGVFNSSITINGAGVGSITVPVVFTVGPVGGGPIGSTNPTPKFSQIGIYRGSAGLFVLDANGNNAFDLPADTFASFGQAGDIPVAGDWDGSGTVRIGVYRPSNGHWYLDMNNNGKWDGVGTGLDADVQFGAPSATCTPTSAAGLAACQDIPVAGDWNGSGVTKFGIYRSGTWFLDNNKPLDPQPHTWSTFVFGQAGDIPVVANWNGSGTTDQIGVYRKGVWYADTNGNGVFDPATEGTPFAVFGSAGDIPVTGNWNGSSTTGQKRIGVFSAVGQWFLDINGDHTFSLTFDTIANYGQPADLPVVGGPWTIAH